MALSLWLDPGDWRAAYQPIIWQFISDLHPLTDPRQSGLAIIAIRQPTAQELIDHPQLTEDSVLLEHAPFFDTSIYYAGSSLEIYSNGLYDGVCKVLERIDLQIDLVDLTWKKVSSVGLFRVHFTNFQVWVEVESENMTEPVILKISPTPENDDGTGTIIFEADVRDILARHFKDIKRLITPGEDNPFNIFVGADGYITQRYTLRAYEAYDVVSETGISTFTVFDDFPVETPTRIAVNAVQPFHEVRRDGTIRLDWFDKLDDYVLRVNGTGGRRLLTHASPTSQFVTPGDDHFLAFLFETSVPVDLNFAVSFYTQIDAGGSFISSDIYSGSISGKSAIFYVGPANITVPTNAKSYRVAVMNQNENIISEVFTFNIRECEGANIRFHYLNKLGGVDSFTFQGEEERTLNVSRDIISKPHMSTKPGFFVGDFNRRVWRTQPDRRYTISSGYLLTEQIHSITETLFESANVWRTINDEWWTPVLIFTNETPADGSSERRQRMSLEYGLGVDNVTQRT